MATKQTERAKIMSNLKGSGGGACQSLVSCLLEHQHAAEQQSVFEKSQGGICQSKVPEEHISVQLHKKKNLTALCQRSLGSHSPPVSLPVIIEVVHCEMHTCSVHSAAAARWHQVQALGG